MADRAVIIVPHHNDEVRLDLLLASIQPQCSGRRLEWSVIVIDDASRAPEKAEAVARKYGAIVARGSGKGSYSARNLGISLAGEVVGYVFTDSDCIWERDAVAAYEEWLLGDDPRMLAAGPITLFPQKTQRPTRWEFLDMTTGLLQEKKVKEEQVAVTANLAVRSEGFVRYGLFNESFRSGGDIEFTRRISQAAGGIAWLAGAAILHPARASKEEHLAKMRRVQRGTLERVYRNGRIPLGAGLLQCWNAIRPPFHTWNLIFRSRRGGLRDKLGASWAAVEQRLARARFVLGEMRAGPRPTSPSQAALAKDPATTA